MKGNIVECHTVSAGIEKAPWMEIRICRAERPSESRNMKGMPGKVKYPNATAITSGPKYHFFGYYDKSPWDNTQRYLLALETDFMDRPPGPQDEAALALVDLKLKERKVFAKTRAWNWQQGCRLQWIGRERDRLVLYNDRRNGEFVGIVHDIRVGERRVLRKPIYDVSADGRVGLTLDFEMLQQVDPGYGYAMFPRWAPCASKPHTEGIYLMDLASGESQLLFSVEDVMKIDPEQSMVHARHWFNHIMLSPDQKRFAFLHRWKPSAGDESRGSSGLPGRFLTYLRRAARNLEQKASGQYLSKRIFRLLHVVSQRIPGTSPFRNRMFTVNLDGSSPKCFPADVSHFDWMDSDTIVAWANAEGQGEGYFLFSDLTGQITRIGGGVLNGDGHCSYCRGSGWIVTDTYPNRSYMRKLMVYHVAKNLRLDIGSYYSIPELRGEIRCDLHPRWSPDGRQICFDSTHEGGRQIYVVDAAQINESGCCVGV